MFWAAAAACAVAEAGIILSSVKSLSRTKGANAARETIWAVLPAIALAWLLFATWGQIARTVRHQQMTMPMQMPSSHS